MTDRETLDRARLLFVGDTQGDMIAREVIAIAERLIPQTEPSPYRPLNLKRPAEYRPLVSMTRSKP